MASALLLVLLLSPGPTHTLKYRFEKGMTYESTSWFLVKQRIFAQQRIVKFHMEMDQVLERTVLELDGDGRPTVERVKVKKWTANFIDWPDRESGQKDNAAQGLTFVWRKKRNGAWGLFDRKQEVTKKHPGLVQKLQPWRDARLPKKPVAVGGSWEVDAKSFLSAAGMQVPEGVAGRAVFKLEEVKKGVAWISFEFKMAYRDTRFQFSGTQKGIWRFDLGKGRDLSFRIDGETEVDNGRSGFGTVKMKRSIAYR